MAAGFVVEAIKALLWMPAPDGGLPGTTGMEVTASQVTKNVRFITLIEWEAEANEVERSAVYSPRAGNVK